MAFIRQRKGKKGTSYYIEYYIDGKKYTHTISYKENKTLKEVKRIAAELELKAQPPDFDNLTIKQFFDICLQNMESNIDENTSKNLKKIIQMFLLFSGESIKVNLINHNYIDEYKDWLYKKRKENSIDIEKTKRGINTDLSFIRWIFNYGYRKDFIKNKIFEKVDFFKTQEYVPDFLTKNESRKLYKNLPKTKIRLYFIILKYTGMRRIEVLRLQGKNIDLENGLILLEKHKNRRPTMKPIHPTLKRIFISWKVLSGDQEQKLFDYHKNTITLMFRRALVKAGLGHKKASVHIMRHTYATRIIEHHQDDFDKGERLAQELLDHTNRKSTKIYTHIVKKVLQQQQSKVKF